MKPVDFPEANFTYTAPANMPDVQPLRAHVSNAGITQCWEVSEEDLEILKVTKKFYLHIVSHACPPIGITTAIPFPAPEFPDDTEEVIEGEEEARYRDEH